MAENSNGKTGDNASSSSGTSQIPVNDAKSTENGNTPGMMLGAENATIKTSTIDMQVVKRGAVAGSIPHEEINLEGIFGPPSDQNNHKGHDFRGATLNVHNYYSGGEKRNCISGGESSSESSRIQISTYLSEILKGLPHDKLARLTKELQEKFHIYSVPDDLLEVDTKELERDIETVKIAQKRKFLRHVEKIQKDCKPALKQISDEIFVDCSKTLRKGYKVYRGERRLPGGADPEQLAVKILDILEPTRDDKVWPRKFIEEINNMSKLHHNNVAKFVHCGEIKNNIPRALYIATSLCHEKTLDDIDVAVLQHRQRISMLAQICHAVMYIHGQKVSHRDLRPTNVLISLDGKRVVICDFGLSKSATINPTMATISSSFYDNGRHGWIAPEMRRDKNPDEKDFFKADIFIIGLLGHYLFCDKRHAFCNDDELSNEESTLQHNIFKGQSNFKALKKTEEGHIAANLLEKMLNCDPAKRPKIQQVLQHCIFWDTDKKVQFIIDMHGGYFDKDAGLNLKENGTEEQKLAYDDITHAKVQNEKNGFVESCDAPLCPTSSISSNFSSSDEGESLDSGGHHESLSTDSESSSGCLFMSPSERVKEQKRKEIRNVCSGRWMDFIMDATNRVDAEKSTTDKANYPNTLVDLIRYIRNYHVHRIRDTEATWKFFAPKFPELLPFLIKIMESTLSDQHESKYKSQCAPAFEVDLSHLLS